MDYYNWSTDTKSPVAVAFRSLTWLLVTLELQGHILMAPYNDSENLGGFKVSSNLGKTPRTDRRQGFLND